ncbi:UNVERIFIED_CONTAM: hypothetical protein O8I53_06370 [Campylobacter lari]
MIFGTIVTPTAILTSVSCNLEKKVINKEVAALLESKIFTEEYLTETAKKTLSSEEIKSVEKEFQEINSLKEDLFMKRSESLVPSILLNMDKLTLVTKDY